VPLEIGRGMRATSVSVILPLVGTACEPRIRLGYRNECNFSRPNCNGFWLRRYAYILMLIQTDEPARAKLGLSTFKILGAIKTNLLRFDNEFHAAGIGHGQGK
jgi:hypothetical protein